MNPKEPTIKARLAQREREIRVVQAVVGGIVGAVGGASGAGYLTYTGGVATLVVGLIGAVLGAVGGYYAPPWLSSLEP